MYIYMYIYLLYCLSINTNEPNFSLWETGRIGL